MGRHIDQDDLALYAPGNHANAHHVMMRLVTGDGVARTGPALRVASRIIVRHARGLFGFRVVATHIHMVLLGGRAAAGRTTQAVEVALGAGLQLAAPFERARIRPIQDVGHLVNTLRYLFKQEEHHGTLLDPAHDGSSLPDLLGLRVVDDGAMVRRVKSHLPWLEAADLRRWVSMEELGGFDPDPAHLLEASAAAFALPKLEGRSEAEHRARRAAVHAVTLRGRDVAALLRIKERSVRDLRSQLAGLHEVRAVTQQMRWRTALAARAGSWTALGA